jgi:prepilin-type processing-associated H-X9-DG protein
MSKRGCKSEPSGRPLIDRSVFSKATPSVLLDDYARGLDALRARKEIDPSRIVLSGASEGTRLAPQLALRAPAGIVGIALAGYAADNQRDVVVWQNTVGPWRNIQKLIPAAADGTLTRAEYDAAVKEDASIATKLPFASVDSDADGSVTATDMARLVRPRLDAILKAVDEGNDDFIWQVLLNLSSAYLREGWDSEPNSATLLKLNIPLAIFHGDLDGTTRVEGVRETEAGSVDAAWVFTQGGVNHWWFWWDLDPRNRVLAQKRIGSYAGNTWVTGGRWFLYDNYPFEKEAFQTESQIRDSSRTPVFADGSGGWWYWGGFGWGCRATDPPSRDLVTGFDPLILGMGTFNMPRHGSRPRRIPKNHPASQLLPGAINISFYDGHVAAVKLERLWSLYWHKDYVALAKRPGL